MEQQVNKVKCMYCHFQFEPNPQVYKTAKGKKRTYIECPRCGNGIEREYRWYDRPRKVALV